MSQQAATVLKNVFQFANILNQASSTDIQKWDDVSVSNAVDWAEYCQELYIRLKGLPCESDLNSHLAQMTMLLAPVSCLHLTLDSLQSAKYLLVNTLMSNPSLSAQLQGKLKVTLSNTQDGKEILSKIHLEDSRRNNAVNFFESLQRSSENVSESIEKKLELHANFLVHHLINIVNCAKKKDRFESYCYAICDKLMQSTVGNDVFVNMFKVKFDDVEDERLGWLQVVHGHLIGWCRRRVQHDPLNCPLLKADLDDVVSAASSHPEVLNLYLDVLSAWTDSCLPEIQGSGCLVWVSADGSDSCSITHHFQCLLSRLSSTPDDQRMRDQVLELLVKRVQGRGFNAWRSVASGLLQVLKQG